MAPIYDTDLAEERYKSDEWRAFELWEKVEKRFRKRKNLWILATVVLFLILSSVPVYQENAPRWQARTYARKLAIELNRVKFEAISQKKTLELEFRPNSLDFDVVEKAKCDDVAAMGSPVRSGSIDTEKKSHQILSKELANEFNLPGIESKFCYSALTGARALQGMAVISREDAQSHRGDRVSVIILTGESAEISFD